MDEISKYDLSSMFLGAHQQNELSLFLHEDDIKAIEGIIQEEMIRYGRVHHPKASPGEVLENKEIRNIVLNSFLHKLQEEKEKAQARVEEAETRMEEEKKAREEAEERAKEAEALAEQERQFRREAEKANRGSKPFSFMPINTLGHNNTKMATHVFQGRVNLDQLTLFEVMRTGKNKKEDELTTSCTLSREFFDTGYLEFSSNPLSPYDREVYDAISSHYEAGNIYLTVAEIYRAMTGKVKGNNYKPSIQQAEAIASSIQRMGMLRVKIDCTNELRVRGMDISYGKLNAIALEYRSLEGESSHGKPFTIYEFTSEPVLFSYAKAVKQIIPIPMKFLDTPTNNSEELLVIKKYLLTRILNMAAPNNSMVQNVILLEHVYEQTAAKSKDKKNNARENVKKLLDYWKRESLFKNYSFSKKGTSFHGIVIKF